MHEWQRKTHYVEIVPFDARDVRPSITLNRVCTGFIENVFAMDVVENLRICERIEPDTRPVETIESFVFHLIHHTYGGQNDVLAPR